MGIILDTDDDILGLERRNESYVILDLKREYKPGSKTTSKHIFAYADGEIEMSNEFLLGLIVYFEENPDERQEIANAYKRQMEG